MIDRRQPLGQRFLAQRSHVLALAVVLPYGCGHPEITEPVSTCFRCHPSQVASWRSSRHAVARTNPIFVEAYNRAQDPWCLTCHFDVGCASCQRLELRICADLACRHPVGRAGFERRLIETKDGWKVAADTRIPPPVGKGLTGSEAETVVHLPAGRAWQLYYHLTDPRHPPTPGSSWLVQFGGAE